jgi:putative MATE family efflux protein
MDMRIYGIFFAFINLGFRTFYIGITHTGILTWSTALMAIVNVILDYLLIFGHFGFPAMGIQGAALASVIAEISATVYFLMHTYTKIDREKYQLMFFKSFDRPIFRNILKISTPIMIQHFAAITSWMIFFLIIEKIGSRELAISHIIRSIYMVLMIPLFGFAAATTTLVSNLIGMGKIREVMLLVKRIMILALSITLAIVPFNLLLPEQLLSIYTTDPSIILDSIKVLNVITGAMFLFSIAFILFSAVSGSGNTQISLLIELSTLCIYLTSAYYIGVVLKSSLPVVWCSEFIYFGVMGFLSFLYLKFGSWHLKKI